MLRHEDKQRFFQLRPCPIAQYVRARTRDALMILKSFNVELAEDKRLPCNHYANRILICTAAVRPETNSPRSIADVCLEPE